MDKQTYEKGGSAGSKGSKFQVHLLAVFILNALRMKLTNWRLSTEDKRAGKFDDVVLEWSEGVVLLQAKHKENKKRIMVEQLMSTTSKNGDFDIPKYFLSYQEIKDKFPKIKKAVICTNAGVNENALKFLKPQIDSSDSILFCEEGTCLFYTLEVGILSELKDKIKTYYRNITGREVDETVISDEKLKDFRKHFQMYFDYPPETDLDNVIEQLLDATSWRGEVSALEIYSKVMDWFQQKSGKYLTELDFRAMISEIRRDKRWQSFKKYNVHFLNNDFNFNDVNRRYYHFIAESNCLLQEIRIWQALRGIGKEILCIRPDDSIEDQKQLIKVFQLQNYIVLIIVQPSELVVTQMWHQIEEILFKFVYKKLVLCTTKRDNELVRLIQLGKISFNVIKEPPIFKDLSEGTQDRLLKSKKILFQGNVVSLEELFIPEPIRNYKGSLGSEILERLVEGELIRVGSEVRVLEEEVERSYIPRNFIRKNEVRHEGNIFEANDRIVLIADSPGMGKSTTLTKLAVLMKERSPHLWVVKIVLDHYSKFLKDSLGRHTTMIDIMEFLDSQGATRLKNQLDKLVFSMDNKVVLMLDGIDEIRPHYIELVESILVNCLRTTNCIKIFATTRLHLVKKLEEKFQVKSFAIEPFSQINQIEFLRNYWLHNLGHSNIEKCEQYARTLVQKMCLWTNSDFYEENNFTAIPLQIKMAAEIFQKSSRRDDVEGWEGCKEFLNADRRIPKLPKEIGIIRLYKLFMERKRDVFIRKFNPTGSSGAEQALIDQFEQCLAFHRTLGLKIIFDDEKICNLFSCYKEGTKICKTNALKVGIIQETDNILCFLHRTLAEYFVAECLLIELQRHNKNTKFQKFFVDGILGTERNDAICIFLDGLLQDSVDSLPGNIFQNYQRLLYDVYLLYSRNFSLVHDLARSGCVAILKLLLKCVDFKIIKGKQTSISTRFVTHYVGNRLNILQYFVQRGGINIEGEFGKTPLHEAANRGRLEMVKFLVEQGANINTTDGEGTPLQEAVIFGHSAVVKFLVEQGADIIGNVRQDRSALYTAIYKNNVPFVNYLLDKILESVCLERGLDAEYAMIPFAVAYLGRIDVLKFLVESGIDTNTMIENGQSLIFGAAMGGQLEAVKYLTEQGADISSRDMEKNTVLHLISKNSHHTYMFKHFLDLGMDINVKNDCEETPLLIAVESGAEEMVQFLGRSGADLNCENKFTGNSILFILAIRRRFETLKLLVEHGADLNAINSFGGTILHDFVTVQWDLDIVKCLIKLGANVNIENVDGDTALHEAVSSCNIDTVKYLVNCGIDVNSKHRDGYTYLHFLVYTHHIKRIAQYNKLSTEINKESFHILSLKRLDMVKYFVERGANFDIVNNEGQTVLYLAILGAVLYCSTSSFCNQCLLVANFLIERGASISIEGSNEEAKVALAKEIQNHERYRWKGLKTILQLPVFRLLDPVSPSTREGDAPSTSVWIPDTSEVASNTKVPEMAPTDKK